MPGIKCMCGAIVKFGEIPNPNEWLLMSDVEYGEYSGEIDSEDLYRKFTSMLVCEQCKRLWIYWQGYRKDPVPYIIDSTHSS
jgi:hypothetical protein